MDPNLSARLDGQFLLGDQPAFAWNWLVGGPASVDLFLGNAPGTTALANQTMIACSGSFTASTSAAVQAALNALASYAGLSYPVGLPTADRYPANYIFTKRWCYFLPAEFKPSAVVSAPGNTYTATYKLVFREATP